MGSFSSLTLITNYTGNSPHVYLIYSFFIKFIRKSSRQYGYVDKLFENEKKLPSKNFSLREQVVDIFILYFH